MVTEVAVQFGALCPVEHRASDDESKPLESFVKTELV
jgi:hypothetical protein